MLYSTRPPVDSLRFNSTPDIYERYAEHYKRQNEISEEIPGPEGDGSFEANLRRHLPAKRDVPVLDFGCGMGHLMLYFKRLGFTAVDGIDVSASQIEQCHHFGLPTATLVPLDSGDYLRKRQSYYGVVTAFDVIEHVPDSALMATMMSIYESLLPGGVFVMKVPNAAGVTATWNLYRDITHQRLFSETSAQQLFEAVGFVKIRVVAEVTAYNSAWKGWCLERVRSLLYVVLKSLYRLQSPGSAMPIA